VPEPATEIGHLTRVVADAIAERITARVAEAGFDDIREPQAAVVMAVVAGDLTVTQIAARLGVSPQAVSKTVTELERAGYVGRGHDPDDKRVRSLQLTARGNEVVAASRRARKAVTAEQSRWLGTRDTAELLRLLQHAVEQFDAGHAPSPHATRRTGMRL